MNKAEFNNYLKELGLTQTAFALLLSVSSRTVRRWAQKPDKITGPSKQALFAWVKLHRQGFAWRENAEIIAARRRHTRDLD